MKKSIHKKIKSNRGETLIEALAAILIISLTFAFLCNTINSANKINMMVKNEHPEMSYDGATTYGNKAVCVSRTKNAYQNDTDIHLNRSVVVQQDASGKYLFY